MKISQKTFNIYRDLVAILLVMVSLIIVFSMFYSFVILYKQILDALPIDWMREITIMSILTLAASTLIVGCKSIVNWMDEKYLAYMDKQGYVPFNEVFKIETPIIENKNDS